MAKKIQGGQLVFTVGDDGTLKLLEKKTKGAKKAMDQLGGASQQTDRRIKGVTQQSSNATKNFSKQAQTMQGGIVAVYATIAAQVFAVSAAFQFLKDAMETRNLIQGQQAFGAVTGTAYRTLTKDIQAATGGMLQFKEAAQAAAIGTAAGLSASQLGSLGNAAKNASFALGRDLTDSFNRLVRGVTKAEPELLDELGIILRLEPAMKNYAVQIGKNVKDLTLFEKSQAVANEVLGQAEEKFGAIQKTLDPSAFALAQFSKAFDDMMKNVKEVVGDIAAKVLPFFSKNVGALVSALSLFLIPIVRSILPDFQKMGDTAAARYGQMSEAAEQAAVSAQKAKAALAGSQGKNVTQQLGKESSDYMKANKIKQVDTMPEGQLSKRQLSVRLRNYKNGLGNQSVAYKQFLTNQEIMHASSEGKRARLSVRFAKRWELIQARKNQIYAKSQMMMVAVTKRAAMLMNGAMRLMGWASIIFMIGSAIMSIYKWIKGVDEAAEAEKQFQESTSQRYTELTEDIKKMNDLQAMGILSLSELVQHQGKKMASADILKTVEDYNKLLLTTSSEDRTKGLKAQVATINKLVEATGRTEFKTLAQDMEAGIESGKLLTINLDEQDETMRSTAATAYYLAQQYQSASASAAKWAQTTGALNSALRQQMGGAGKLPMMNLATAYQGALREGRAIQFGRNAAATDESTLSADKAAEAAGMDADIEAARAKRDEYKDVPLMLRAFAGAGDQRGGNAFDVAEQAAQEALDALVEKQKNLNKESKDHAANAEKYTKEAAKYQKEIDAIAGAEDRINQLQEDGMKALEKKMGAQLKLAQMSTQDTTAKFKNNQLDQQAILFNDKLEQSKLAQETAAINLKIATDKGNKEEIEAATQAKKVAGDQLKIDEALVEQNKEKTRFQKLANTHAQETLDLSHEIAKRDQKRQQARAAADTAHTMATSKAEQDLAAATKLEQDIATSKDKQLQIELKRTQNDEYAKSRGADSNTIKKNEEELLKLINDKFLLEQKITLERAKQNGLITMAQESLNQEAKQKKITNMTSGGTGALPGFGMGNITPQAVELNRILAEHNLTIAEAAQRDKDGKEGGLIALSKQADAAAKMNIEMNLAQKTSDIMRSGFDSLFQALLDGTQSFGDAMKGVMKQVLADLAAAYMTAAAMTALRAMGLPLPGARYGGVMSPSGKSYAYGGIAQGPESGYLATLHGNEAVIPLGNDRSVPVEMKGQSGGNTVNVTVNMAGGQGQTSTTGDGAMQGLGRSIGGLVQQHLQQEMRPGGLLNQQGTKGRT